MASLDEFQIDGTDITNNDATAQQTQAVIPQSTNSSLADGELSITDSGSYFTPANTATNTPATDTVEGRMTGLLSSDSDYMKLNKSQAQQTANKSGLINSLMAATAGQKAAIESVLPIAQQDASYSQTQGLNAQQGNIQSGLYEKQGEISSNLSAQQAEQDMALKQADIEWNKLELQAKMDVEFAKLDQENKDMFNTTAYSIAADYTKSYQELVTNPDFATAADKQFAIEVLNENTKQAYSIAASIAGIELDWGSPTTAAETENADLAAAATGVSAAARRSSDDSNPTAVSVFSGGWDDPSITSVLSGGWF